MSFIIKSIAIASDHAGYDLKLKVISYLKEKGISFVDYGTNSSESVDYTDYAHRVAKVIEKNEQPFGILICGTGIGVSITANRYRNIRCALCWDSEIAVLARKHNNANVLALAGRYTDETTAKKIVDAFITTEFEGGRHLRRIEKING